MSNHLSLPDLGFPGDSDGKKKQSAWNVGNVGSILGLGRSPGEWQPIPVILPGEWHENSLVGYSPCDYQESDMTDTYCGPGFTKL